MMDQERKELIQAAVDGELDAAGCARVEQLLAESPEARELHEDLRRLGEFIGRVPPVEPPASLHGQIVDGIALPGPAGLGRFFRFESLPGFVRYGLAGAAAVVVTVAVYQGGAGLDPAAGTDDLLGTIASRGDMAGGREVDAIRFQAGDSGGEVRLAARGDHYALVFDLALDQPTNVEVVLPGGGFRIDAFARQTEDPASTVAWADNRFSASLQGRQRFVLRLSRSAPAAPGDVDGEIALRFTRDDAVLHSGTMSTQDR